MSAFTKPPHDASAPPPADPQAPKPAPKPAGPPVVVTRTIDVGGTYKPRPAAPTANLAPPPVSKAAPPAPAPGPPPPPPQPVPPPKAPTLRFDAPTAKAPPSTRPAAPAMGGDPDMTVQTASIADTFERLLSSDIDQGFDAIERKTGESPQPGDNVGLHAADLTEVRALFEQLAASYVRPVRDFLMDLRWGEAAVDWIDVCEPALRSLRRAAEKLELTELCTALDALSATLAAAKASPSKTIDGDRRAAILTSHDRLVVVMPQAFSLDVDRTKRESVILHSVLLQVPDVKKVTIDKLYAAGVTTLEAMLLATPADLVATTGLDEDLAKRIVARFRDYRAQVRASIPDATRAQERDRVAQLTARLKQQHEGFQRASTGWSEESGARKKELRGARDRTLLEIQVVLARLGEVERLAELERLPFERKLANLEAFLEEARDKYVAQP
jgi:hypothetical protein